MMRDFYWHYFATTGCIDAYLLYTEEGQIDPQQTDMGAMAGTDSLQQTVSKE